MSINSLTMKQIQKDFANSLVQKGVIKEEESSDIKIGEHLVEWREFVDEKAIDDETYAQLKDLSIMTSELSNLEIKNGRIVYENNEDSENIDSEQLDQQETNNNNNLMVELLNDILSSEDMQELLD